MLTTIRYVVLTAMRDRLFSGLLAGVIAGAMISAFLGNTAFLEEQEMTIVYAAGAARLMLAVGLIVFVCFHLRNAFDTREIDVMLSRPISRTHLVLAYWAGFSCVATMLVLPSVGIVGLLALLQPKGFALWGLSLWCESLLVVALAMFCALTLRSAVTAVLGSLGIYVLARMMAFFVMTSESGMLGAQFYHDMVATALRAVSMVMPRLDFFAHTEWLVYGLRTGQEWMLFGGQAAIFVPLLLAMSVLDFKRKQF